MRKALRSLVSTVAATLHSQDAPRILYYHRVDEDDARSCVRPEQFRLQMRYLATQHYRVLSLADLLAYFPSKSPLPHRAVVLTFDDGFADNYTQAYPILRTFGFPATIFLTVGFIGTPTLPVLSRTAKVFPPLTWEQVCEMDQHDISFGSHTLTHPSLPLLRADEMIREVRASRALLEEKIGHPIDFFCYPKGEFTPAVQTAVQQAGYTGACSITPGAVRAQSDRFALPRTYIGRDDTLADFRKKLHGGYDLLHAVGQLWQRTSSTYKPGVHDNFLVEVVSAVRQQSGFRVAACGLARNDGVRHSRARGNPGFCPAPYKSVNF